MLTDAGRPRSSGPVGSPDELFAVLPRELHATSAARRARLILLAPYLGDPRPRFIFGLAGPQRNPGQGPRPTASSRRPTAHSCSTAVSLHLRVLVRVPSLHRHVGHTACCSTTNTTPARSGRPPRRGDRTPGAPALCPADRAGSRRPPSPGPEPAAAAAASASSEHSIVPWRAFSMHVSMRRTSSTLSHSGAAGTGTAPVGDLPKEKYRSHRSGPVVQATAARHGPA
jgi:hypothetical protein